MLGLKVWALSNVSECRLLVSAGANDACWSLFILVQAPNRLVIWFKGIYSWINSIILTSYTTDFGHCYIHNDLCLYIYLYFRTPSSTPYLLPYDLTQTQSVLSHSYFYAAMPRQTPQPACTSNLSEHLSLFTSS